MMMQTLLSAAAPAHRGDPCVALRLEWRRHSCLRSFSRPGIPRVADAPASLAREIPGTPWRLIANLELEFHLTQRKLSPLRISNRKFSPILCFFTNHQSRVTSHRFLIHGNAIKTSRNAPLYNHLQFSNRRQMAPQATQNRTQNHSPFLQQELRPAQRLSEFAHVNTRFQVRSNR